MPRTAAQGLDGNIPLFPRRLKHLTTEPTGGPTVSTRASHPTGAQPSTESCKPFVEVAKGND